MKPSEFVDTRPVFTGGEFASAVAGGRKLSNRAVESLLAYYSRTGQVLRVRRGLYVTVPPGVEPRKCPVDPYLLAGKMTPDAVLAYHTALECRGKAYSVHSRLVYLTGHNPRPSVFRAYEFRGVSFPAALRQKGRERFGVEQLDRSGVTVDATNLERTLVDVLNRPDLSGGWEEIWRSLEMVEYFDLAQVAEYARLLGNSTTAAKVGFFLEQHREALMVDDSDLRELRELRPLTPHYMERRHRTSGRLVPQWNLIVPVQVFERSWGDVT